MSIPIRIDRTTIISGNLNKHNQIKLDQKYKKPRHVAEK